MADSLRTCKDYAISLQLAGEATPVCGIVPYVILCHNDKSHFSRLFSVQSHVDIKIHLQNFFVQLATHTKPCFQFIS